MDAEGGLQQLEGTRPEMTGRWQKQKRDRKRKTEARKLSNTPYSYFIFTNFGDPYLSLGVPQR